MTSLFYLANRYDPRYAKGIFQDAIGELYFMTRKLATRSQCPVVFWGLTGAGNFPKVLLFKIYRVEHGELTALTISVLMAK